MPALLLASSSPYRRALLQKLGLPFTCASPDIDETPRPGEDARTLTARLAEDKARALASRYPAALIIGSDQVCTHQGLLLGKGGNREGAIQQLQLLNGQQVSFLTGLCLLNSSSGQALTLVDEFKVHFRQLSQAQINHYVDRERPFDCAGSFKSEGLGITLFERLEGDDPNSLIGLPLIRLSELLRQQGVEVLASHQN